MKKLLGLLFILVTTSFGVFAQTDKAEIKQLRQELNLSKSTSIIINKDTDFPSQNTIKIFPAIKHNKSFARDFVEWVKDWNKDNANKFGKLEIVDRIEDADIVATQFRYGIRKYVREERITASTGKISKDEDDDFIGQGIGNSKVRVESGYEAVKFPLYSYLLVRGANNSWILDFSYVDNASDYNKTFPEARLQGIIEGKMRKR
ncbi:MAG TPA: hypothetical protein VNI60_00535 [Pyrinomonadaceae bacterium]|nr:hypothetical protein [Pyrinomonadaceae bacterium]